MTWLIVTALIAAGALVARRAPVPDAVIWCALGLAVAFIPGFPLLEFDPRIALFVFLPPLVYSSAVVLPWPEFRDNLRPIAMLALGLVAITTTAVAAVAHGMAGLGWAPAVVLGAIVSPTDPVAASSVAGRAGLPHRLVAILEGEGLVNDAVALTVFRVALSAAAAGSFSLEAGVVRFLCILIGEPLYGWLVGIAFAWLRSRIEDPRTEIAVTLLTPYAAYLAPELLGGSGILATVAAGMYIGERHATLVPAGTRLHAIAFWQMLVFLLNGSLFIMAGMELRRVVASHGTGSPVLWWGLAIGGVVAAVRFTWCAVAWAAARMPLRRAAVIAWAGMRGPISLAAALSIPAAAGAAGSVPSQNLLYITSVVIVFTLFVQGGALEPVVRTLGVTREAQRERQETAGQEFLGEVEAARAALDALARMEKERAVSPDAAKRLREYYEGRIAEANPPDAVPGQEVDRVRARLIAVERARVLQLREQGRINDYAVERLQRALDLRESLLE
jgi:Na+/H+ antiporter